MAQQIRSMGIPIHPAFENAFGSARMPDPAISPMMKKIAPITVRPSVFVTVCLQEQQPVSSGSPVSWGDVSSEYFEELGQLPLLSLRNLRLLWLIFNLLKTNCRWTKFKSILKVSKRARSRDTRDKSTVPGFSEFLSFFKVEGWISNSSLIRVQEANFWREWFCRAVVKFSDCTSCTWILVPGWKARVVKI